MNIFLEIFNDWSRYEIILLSISVFLFTFMGPAFAWVFVKDRRATIFALISSLITTFLVVSTVVVVATFISNITESYSYIYLLTGTFSALNVMTLTNYLVAERGKKDFDIDFVTREHFNDTLKLVSIIILFFSALLIFFKGDLRNIIIASAISSVLALSTNHLLARILFKDRDEK